MGEDVQGAAAASDGAAVRCWSRADLAALAVLWLAAAVIGAPVLFGGWRSYLDNPVHIAELIDMARPDFNGWSDIALCGLPLGTVHSPVWPVLLATLHRWGLPLGPLYATALLAAFAAPATVLYALARRRLPAVGACAIAYLLLIQYPVTVGIASALGGMWTFYIASAFFLLLLDALAADRRGLPLALRIAALTALVGLSHSFFFPLLGLAAALHGLMVLLRPKARRVLAWDIPAMGLGLVAAAAQWLPLVLVKDWLQPPVTNVRIPYLLKHLLLPIDMLLIRQNQWLTWSEAFHAIPLVVLFGLGVAGTAVCAVRSDERRRAGLRGIALGWVVLLLLFVVSGTKVTWLGPLSWRLLYATRLGFALAAIPLLALAPRGWPRSRTRLAGLGLLAVLAGAVWGAPLSRTTLLPGDRELVEATRLWQWLREHRDPGWGRVMVQDSFFTAEPQSIARWTHLLARTAAESGITQIGPYYSGLPFPTAFWAATEFSWLLGIRLEDEAAMRALKLHLTAADVTHAVLSEPRAKARLDNDPDFAPLGQVGSFAIYRFGRGRSRPAFSSAGITAEVERPSPGRLRVRTEGAAEGDLYVSEAYHPFWKLDGPAGITVGPGGLGLIKLHLPAGRHEVSLAYVAPSLPHRLTAAAWALLGLVALGHELHRRKRRASAASERPDAAASAEI